MVNSALLRPVLVTTDTKIPEPVVDNIEFHLVTSPDEWLKASYELLAAQFSADLLDPIERYATWLELNQQNLHTFPFLLLVAFIRQGEKALLAGVFEGNLMSVVDYVGNEHSHHPLSILSDGTSIFTVGHQMTCPVLRELGIKGIGTRLWQQSLATAASWAEQRGGTLRYSVLESEEASIAFWTKMGFGWPEGSIYWQPPLEFDEYGQYLHPPVKELLMLNPVTGEGSVERTMLLNIVATLYQNWSLDAYRLTLSEDALATAERYVMGKLLDQVYSCTPTQKSIPLTNNI